jgi:hypothetical protein
LHQYVIETEITKNILYLPHYDTLFLYVDGNIQKKIWLRINTHQKC